MSKRSDGQARGRYTLEFKMEAVRLVKGGQASAVTAKVLGMPKQTLENWVRLSEKGQLKGAGDKPVSVEQMELARLRAELARVKMERDILKKRRRTSPGNLCEVRLDCKAQGAMAGHAGLARCCRSAPAATSSTGAVRTQASPVEQEQTGASATKPCWCISGASMPKSSRNTAGPGCAKSCWPGVYGWARSACAG